MTDRDGGLQALARRFEHFAAHDCTDDALYVALCRLLARRPQALAWLLRAAPTQRKPNLLLAALHARVLAGGAHALRPYYGSAGGTRAPDAELAAALDAALHDEHDALAHLVATRSTQTNEIGRCAVLWPALCALATQQQARDIALLDFGCSAGLNLGVDVYRYSYPGCDDDGRSGDRPTSAVPAPARGDAQAPLIACRWIGDAALPGEAGPPRIVQRLGIDPAPVDVARDDEVAWLHACLWPSDRERAARLDGAVAIARRASWPVQRQADCMAAMAAWLDALPRGVLPVVFSSFVLMYLGGDGQARHIDALRALARQRGLLWISAEGPGLGLADHAPPPATGIAGLADAEIANGALWWAVDRNGATCLARSHPHGRWMQWFGADAVPSAPR